MSLRTTTQHRLTENLIAISIRGAVPCGFWLNTYRCIYSGSCFWNAIEDFGVLDSENKTTSLSWLTHYLLQTEASALLYGQRTSSIGSPPTNRQPD